MNIISIALSLYILEQDRDRENCKYLICNFIRIVTNILLPVHPEAKERMVCGGEMSSFPQPENSCKSYKEGNDSPQLTPYQGFHPKSSREGVESFQPGHVNRPTLSEDHLHAWEGWAVVLGNLSPWSCSNWPSLLPHHGIVIICIFFLLSHQKRGHFLTSWSRFYLFTSGCQIESTHY